eukprot:TRINITY_DN2316_c0_g1_i1.p2 TRINITY_DN2316_c0_g1~~TRINITY_DN2316_c0_g1_i1.p2  ORF type:complete len:195 (-),score=68.82 TRINITY_DN2316_c0_g1_i1:142-726(-)
MGEEQERRDVNISSEDLVKMKPEGPANTKKPLKLDTDRLTCQNVGQLKKLNLATFPVHYNEQFYEDLMKSLDYCVLGYFADVLVSSICCRLEDRKAGGKSLYIMTLSVLKAYRRRSLASQLVRCAIDKACSQAGKDDGIQDMYLHVQTSNTEALSFYGSFGFEVTEEIKNYYTKIDPPDCYVLRKRVNQEAAAA